MSEANQNDVVATDLLTGWGYYDLEPRGANWLITAMHDDPGLSYTVAPQSTVDFVSDIIAQIHRSSSEPLEVFSNPIEEARVRNAFRKILSGPIENTL